MHTISFNAIFKRFDSDIEPSGYAWGTLTVTDNKPNKYGSISTFQKTYKDHFIACCGAVKDFNNYWGIIRSASFYYSSGNRVSIKYFTKENYSTSYNFYITEWTENDVLAIT